MLAVFPQAYRGSLLDEQMEGIRRFRLPFRMPAQAHWELQIHLKSTPDVVSATIHSPRFWGWLRFTLFVAFGVRRLRRKILGGLSVGQGQGTRPDAPECDCGVTYRASQVRSSGCAGWVLGVR